jgi:hypothetical protein
MPGKDGPIIGRNTENTKELNIIAEESKKLPAIQPMPQ